MCECVYKSIPPHIYFSLLLLQKLAVVVVLLLFTHTHTPNNKTIPFDFRFALAALLVLIETVEEEVNSSLHFFIQFPSLDFSSSRRLPYLSLGCNPRPTHTQTRPVRREKILIIPTGTFSTFQKTPEVLILI